MSIYRFMQLIYRVQWRCHRHGAETRIHKYLIDEIMDQDKFAWKTINDRPQPVTIAYKSVWPMKNVYVSKFKNNEDLCDVLVASCNIPYYMKDNFFVKCRGHKAIDGFFCNIQNFGCPQPYPNHTYITNVLSSSNSLKPVKRIVNVVCYWAPNIPVMRIGDKDNTYDELNEHISPLLCKYDDIDIGPKDIEEYYNYVDESPVPSPDLNFIREFDHKDVDFEHPDSTKPTMLSSTLEMLKAYPFPTQSNKNRRECSNYSQYIKEFRDQGKLPKMPFNAQDILAYALTPASFENVKMLYEMGRSDAYRWIVRERMINNTLLRL